MYSMYLNNFIKNRTHDFAGLPMNTLIFVLHIITPFDEHKIKDIETVFNYQKQRI